MVVPSTTGGRSRCHNLELMTKTIALRGLSLTLIAAFAVCTFSVAVRSARAADSTPIVIGTTVSVTGNYAEDAKYALEGYRLYVKLQNAKGGWLGHPLELKYYDDASDPATAVSLYQKLVTQDHVNILVGPYSSAVTAAVANIADQYKMPMISPEVGSVAPFKRGLRYIFQATAQSTVQVGGSLEIAKAYGYKRLALTGEDTSLPKSIVAAVPDLAKAANMDIVFNELYPHNASDYTAEVLKIKQSNPDLILAVSYFPDSVALLHALKQANVTPKELFFAIGPTEPNFLREVGADANGVMSMSIWNAALKTQGNDAFVKAFKGEYNTDPDYHSALNYAALEVVSAAVANAKGVDNEKIRDFLATQKVQTVAGTYEVDATGAQVGYGALILQWQGNQHYIVWPQKYAQRKPLLPFPSWPK